MAQTKKILVVNRENNMGDAMCQMRALRDYKDRNPEHLLEFATCFPLHWIVANHTDNFQKLMVGTHREVNDLAENFEEYGYDELIEFQIDWGKAVSEGILKSWCETTLGFEPSTDRPYFRLTAEELVTARYNYESLRRKFRKLVIFQPEAVSGVERSFLKQDWQRLYDLFPQDVGIIYSGPVSLALEKPFEDRPNLIYLPGLPVGVTAALMQLVDCTFTVHSGYVMLAHAVGAKNIVHVNFLEASGVGILRVVDGVNIDIPNNREVDWDLIGQLVKEHAS